jgi:hypothetical protein
MDAADLDGLGVEAGGRGRGGAGRGRSRPSPKALAFTSAGLLPNG